MGHILVDKITKGYKEIADQALSEKISSDISPALLKLSDFIASAQSNSDIPLKIRITLVDQPDKSVDISVANINEIRDILHFAIDS